MKVIVLHDGTVTHAWVLQPEDYSSDREYGHSRDERMRQGLSSAMACGRMNTRLPTTLGRREDVNCVACLAQLLAWERDGMGMRNMRRRK